MTPEEQNEKEKFMARRRGRNIALGLLLAFLVFLFYFITIARMGD